MRRPCKPGPDATLREALIYVAWHPAIWPAFMGILARHIPAKARFYVMCWRAGYRVSTVRRLAREARTAGLT
ncbi:hypothetical protein FE249_16005 [Acidiphilium multivorum]|uniref:hypothetical protein n=1 Tax=Acidiphilium multivorum TaxID=62140 RepID=UPI001F4BF030|nr:hypothetical protein [Acidiphilium multivorum]UNC15615.1 hypothetical protein FE249_16005 [Acidiphilium multivorum]